MNCISPGDSVCPFRQSKSGFIFMNNSCPKVFFFFFYFFTDSPILFLGREYSGRNYTLNGKYLYIVCVYECIYLCQVMYVCMQTVRYMYVSLFSLTLSFYLSFSANLPKIVGLAIIWTSL